jgi:hypothetical protein
VVRTYEMVIAPFAIDRNKAEIALMFEKLNTNYGHAGRVYAEYLANNAESAEQDMQKMFTKLATAYKMQAHERFWFAIVAALVIGAKLASKLNLCKINDRTLLHYLLGNLDRLRGRSEQAFHSSEPSEIIAQFMAQYQDRILVVDKFPAPRANVAAYLPDVSGGIPRGDKLTVHVSKEDGLIRFPLIEFQRWLDLRQLPIYSIVKRLENDLQMKSVRVKLGIGTKWELPQQRCYQISTLAMDKAALARVEVIISDDSLSPDDSLDSSPEPAP